MSCGYEDEELAFSKKGNLNRSAKRADLIQACGGDEANVVDVDTYSLFENGDEAYADVGNDGVEDEDWKAFITAERRPSSKLHPSGNKTMITCNALRVSDGAAASAGGGGGVGRNTARSSINMAGETVTAAERFRALRPDNWRSKTSDAPTMWASWQVGKNQVLLPNTQSGTSHENLQIGCAKCGAIILNGGDIDCIKDRSIWSNKVPDVSVIKVNWQSKEYNECKSNPSRNIHCYFRQAFCASCDTELAAVYEEPYWDEEKQCITSKNTHPFPCMKIRHTFYGRGASRGQDNIQNATVVLGKSREYFEQEVLPELTLSSTQPDPAQQGATTMHLHNMHKKMTQAEKRAEEAQKAAEAEVQLKLEAEKTNVELQDALAKAEDDEERAVRMFMKRHNENKTLQAEMETMRKRVQQAENDKNSLETALCGLRKNLEDVKSRNNKIQQEREALERKREDATKALEREKAQLETVKSALASQQQETARLQSEKTHKETELCRLKEESDARVRALEEEKARAEKLQKQIAARIGNNPEHMTWEWELSPGAWEPMAAAVCHELDAHFMDFRNSKGPVQIQNFEMAGARYRIDFGNMSQQRLDTGKVRKIRARVGVPRHWTRDFLPDTVDLRSLPDTSMATVLRKLELSGLPNTLFLRKLCGTHCGSTCPYDLNTARNVQIYQVENLPLWRKYEQARTNVRQDHRRCDIKRRAIRPAVPGEIREAAHILLGDEPELCQNVNEVYLFHGTSATGFEKIVTTGFDFRVAKNTGLYYGQGTYFASNVCKSLQYTGRNRGENKGYLIIARVLVGDPHYTTSTCPEIKHGPESGATGLFRDSIIANAGPMQGHHNGSQAHQEFVIFDKAHAYPEFVIEYSA